jgi:hypothetical protein
MFVIDCALKYYLLHKKIKLKERYLFKKGTRILEKKRNQFLTKQPIRMHFYKLNHVR